MTGEKAPTRLRRIEDPNQAVGELQLAAVLYVLGYAKLAKRGRITADEVVDALREVRDELVSDPGFRRGLAKISRQIGIPDSSRTRAFAQFASRSESYIGDVKGAVEDRG